MAGLSQEAAQRLFKQGSFFLLSGLEQGAEVGIDTSVWAVKRFSGFKFIPPGLHLILFSASESVSADKKDTGAGSLTVRHGVLRFFGQQEVVTGEWNAVAEGLKSRPAPEGGSRRKRRRTLALLSETEEQDLISEDHLKTLDPTLAPYPGPQWEQWKSLVDRVSPALIARVVGLDEKGLARVDALMPSLFDEEELATARETGRRTWGKARDAAGDETQVDLDGDEEEKLEFVHVELKRSWRIGSVGEDLTQWSRDKSWSFSRTVTDDAKGDLDQVLGELQLSFVLFTMLYNFSSLAVYKNLVAAICRSRSLVHPTLMSEASLNLLSPTQTIPFFAAFLRTLSTQLDWLDESFFATQLPGLETFLLEELDILRDSLSEASPAWNAMPSSPSTAWRSVVDSWVELSQVAMRKFGWELGMIKASRREGYGARSDDTDDDDGVPLEDLEEGEDGPVIVDM